MIGPQFTASSSRGPHNRCLSLEAQAFPDYRRPAELGRYRSERSGAWTAAPRGAASAPPRRGPLRHVKASTWGREMGRTFPPSLIICPKQPTVQRRSVILCLKTSWVSGVEHISPLFDSIRRHRYHPVSRSAGAPQRARRRSSSDPDGARQYGPGQSRALTGGGPRPGVARFFSSARRRIERRLTALVSSSSMASAPTLDSIRKVADQSASVRAKRQQRIFPKSYRNCGGRSEKPLN